MDAYTTIVVYILTAILGLCVGSFLNVVIYRLPEHMRLYKPPSHCPSCSYTLKWYHNIPVFSYIFLKGKCKNCGNPISLRYILVELLNMFLWLACVMMFWKENIVLALVYAILCSVLICVSFIDLKHLFIPDEFHIIILLLATVCTIADVNYDIWSHIIGCLVAMALFIPVFYLSMKVYGKEAFGGGDVKLFIACGFFLGWEKLLLSILVAFMTASIILLILAIKNKGKEEKEYPFAPFIAFGTLFAIFFGTPILEWYFAILGG